MTSVINPETGNIDLVGVSSLGGTLSGGTAGSVLFINPANTLAQDNSNFYWDDTNNRLGIRQTAPAESIDTEGNIVLNAVTPPTAAAVALAGLGAGNLSVGDYYYRVTFVTSVGETQVGTASSVVSVVNAGTNGQVAISGIPVGPAGKYYTTSQRKLYRTKTGGSPTYYLLATINDNTTTTYTDNIADSSLTTLAISGYKSTGGRIYFNDAVWGKVPMISCVSNASPFGVAQFYSTYVGWNSGNPNADYNGNNTAIGSESLQGVTTGAGNVAIGPRTGLPITTGSNNVLIGVSAGGSLVTASSNIHIGRLAGLANTADENVYIGTQSGQGTGTGNTCVGTYSMLAGGSNSLSVAIGYYSFAFGSGGIPGSGTAIGWGAGLSAGSSATGFVGLGRRAGAAVTSGTNNTHIGYQAGDSDGTTSSTGTLDNVTTLGYNAQVTQSNSLVLGGLTANGFGVKVGINTTAPSAKLHVISTTEQLRLGYDTSNYYSTTVGSTGAVTFDAVGAGSGFTFSDQITGSAGYVGSDLTASALVLTDSGKKLISGTVTNLATAGIPTVTNVSLTGQTADIGATNLGTVAGLYLVSYSLQDTTSDLTAGAVVLTLSYTDGAGATTATATQVLTGVGRQSGSVYVQLASGNLTYATTHTGLYGTSAYALHITTERVK